MNEFPTGWEVQPLANLCSDGRNSIVDGPFGSNLKRSDYLTSGIPVLKIQNIKENAIILKKMDYVSKEKFQELERHSFAEGDIVMTKLGDPLGVSAIVKDIPDGLIVADLVRIRPTKIVTKFLCYQLNSPRIQKHINELQKGTTRPRVNLSMIRELPIVTPQIEEQYQIVEILEDYLSRLDAAISDVKQAVVKAAQFRRSLLQAAFSGKFSENQINASTKLPKDWKWRTLNDVARWGSGGTPKSSDKSLYGGDIPWIVIGDLTEGLVNETAQTINQKGLDSSSAKLMPPGTVMVAMYGASIGRTGIMAKAMTTNQAIACGMINESIMTKEYLLYYLQSQKQDFINAGKGGAQPNISQGVIKNWKIPVPPVCEQALIIQRIEEQLSHLEHSSKVAIEIELSSKSFRRSLLQAAFTGNLTRDVANV